MSQQAFEILRPGRNIITSIKSSTCFPFLPSFLLFFTLTYLTTRFPSLHHPLSFICHFPLPLFALGFLSLFLSPLSQGCDQEHKNKGEGCSFPTNGYRNNLTPLKAWKIILHPYILMSFTLLFSPLFLLLSTSLFFINRQVTWKINVGVNHLQHAVFNHSLPRYLSSKSDCPLRFVVPNRKGYYLLQVN